MINIPNINMEDVMDINIHYYSLTEEEKEISLFNDKE